MQRAGSIHGPSRLKDMIPSNIPNTHKIFREVVVKKRKIKKFANQILKF